MSCRPFLQTRTAVFFTFFKFIPFERKGIDPYLHRRFTALNVSSSLLFQNSKSEVDEMAGHVYLYLKEQLELATLPLSYGLLHGTIIGV